MMATAFDVPRETRERLNDYVALLLEESERQNLIAKSTVADVWSRHIEDCGQLSALAPDYSKSWADIGSGAGLPGIVIAILTGAPITLIEPRRLRSDFLARVVDTLGLTNATVVPGRAEAAVGKFDLITARAVAKTGDIFGITEHLAHKRTTYLLMKGRSAQSELDALGSAWQGRFSLVPSRTDPDASIIVASEVRRGQA
jgi:16S rRNA (guanine527-N7)-methyltransferase